MSGIRLRQAAFWLFLLDHDHEIGWTRSQVPSVTDFKELRVWQKAHSLMLETHIVTDAMRASKFGALKGQLARAAESIPANIAESRGHDSSREAARFIRIAINSATELEYHLIAARDRGAISSRRAAELTDMLVEVRKMLYGLLKYLTSRPASTSAT